MGKKIVLLPLTPAEIVKHDKELAEISKNDHALDPPVATSQDIKLKGDALLAKTSLNAENYINAAPCRTMLCKYVSFSHDPTPMFSKLCAAVTNLLQEFDGGMESRTTPIQEGEDDEDTTMLGTPKIWSSTSYKSFPTWSSCPVRTQPTTLNENADISFIRHQNEAFFDALERRKQKLSFGSSPSSRRFVGHSV
jgi:hypothetical protein